MFLFLVSISTGFIPKIDSKSVFKVVKSSYFLSIPSIQIETSPVSSETTKQAESETSDIPKAALWRVPYFQLSLGSSVSGTDASIASGWDTDTDEESFTTEK